MIPTGASSLAIIDAQPADQDWKIAGANRLCFECIWLGGLCADSLTRNQQGRSR